MKNAKKRKEKKGLKIKSKVSNKKSSGKNCVKDFFYCFYGKYLLLKQCKLADFVTNMWL